MYRYPFSANTVKCSPLRLPLGQLNQLEHNFSMLEVDHKATQRRMLVAEQENVHLKEEVGV